MVTWNLRHCDSICTNQRILDLVAVGTTARSLWISATNRRLTSGLTADCGSEASTRHPLAKPQYGGCDIGSEEGFSFSF